ncbi:MAG: membrane protein insertion efficiency factor YidD [Nitrospira sp.]|nr:membrane protein insertion efficiency factor YidD [Nitrospira sp.]MCP9461038.1 membrane protein insertion efficiency factor YidD [Nitrospira sp.]MCP9474055.1 membrane protein insertion efficiency factor YidD [Nitrospira sp.]
MMVVRNLCLWLIRAYRYMVSPWLGPACRFDPTCSQYALDAIARYGVLRGGGLVLVRLLKCHPFHPGGEDPVR